MKDWGECLYEESLWEILDVQDDSTSLGKKIPEAYIVACLFFSLLDIKPVRNILSLQENGPQSVSSSSVEEKPSEVSEKDSNSSSGRDD